MIDNLEKMQDFFTARIDEYEGVMLNGDFGAKEGYAELAARIPVSTKRLLDLGCGTGLELEPIFQKIPDLQVVGIDLTQVMLDKLALKYADKDITLINGSYFDVDFGTGFDTAISFETMHHFPPADKLKVYKKIRNALQDGGQYIEVDYIVKTLQEQEALFAENKSIRTKLNVPEGEFYHFDTPCCLAVQIETLQQAGFKKVEKVWGFQDTNTLMLIANR